MAALGDEVEQVIATPEQWQKVKMVVATALEWQPCERSAYLDQVCTQAQSRSGGQGFAH